MNAQWHYYYHYCCASHQAVLLNDDFRRVSFIVRQVSHQIKHWTVCKATLEKLIRQGRLYGLSQSRRYHLKMNWTEPPGRAGLKWRELGGGVEWCLLSCACCLVPLVLCLLCYACCAMPVVLCQLWVSVMQHLHWPAYASAKTAQCFSSIQNKLIIPQGAVLLWSWRARKIIIHMLTE